MQDHAVAPSVRTEPQDVKRAWEEAGESEATRAACLLWNCVWTLEDEIQGLQQIMVHSNDDCERLGHQLRECEAENARLGQVLAAHGLSVWGVGPLA